MCGAGVTRQRPLLALPVDSRWASALLRWDSLRCHVKEKSMRRQAYLGVLLILLISLGTLGRAEWESARTLADTPMRHTAAEPIKMAPNCPSGCYKKQRNSA